VFKPEKGGIARFSTYLLALPAGIMIVFSVFGLYWNAALFLATCIITLVLDYLIDKKYIHLQSKNNELKY